MIGCWGSEEDERQFWLVARLSGTSPVTASVDLHRLSACRICQFPCNMTIENQQKHRLRKAKTWAALSKGWRKYLEAAGRKTEGAARASTHNAVEFDRWAEQHTNCEANFEGTWKAMEAEAAKKRIVLGQMKCTASGTRVFWVMAISRYFQCCRLWSHTEMITQS